MAEYIFLKGYTIDKPITEPYLTSVPAVRYLSEFYFRKPVTFFCGENGMGKSTLLEGLAVAAGFNPEGGTRFMNFATRESHSGLHQSLRLFRRMPFAHDGFFLRAESFYNVATAIDQLEGDDAGFIQRNYGGKSMHGRSHGESFISLVMSRFHGESLFFLDEPEAALSPAKQMALLVRIHELVQESCQFIIATHSPILLSYPNADIIEFSEDSAEITEYKNTETYSLTRYFLNNPEEMQNLLFS